MPGLRSHVGVLGYGGFGPAQQRGFLVGARHKVQHVVVGLMALGGGVVVRFGDGVRTPLRGILLLVLGRHRETPSPKRIGSGWGGGRLWSDSRRDYVEGVHLPAIGSAAMKSRVAAQSSSRVEDKKGSRGG